MKDIAKKANGARRDAAGAQEAVVVSVLRAESDWLAGRIYKGLQQ